jgi:hypothetical protein
METQVGKPQRNTSKKAEAEIREYEWKRAVEDANKLAWMMMQDWLEWA